MTNIDQLINHIRKTFPLTANLAPIEPGMAPIWLNEQTCKLTSFLTEPALGLIEKKTDDAFLDEASVCLAYVDQTGQRQAYLLQGATGFDFRWEFARSHKESAQLLQANDEQIQELVQTHLFANPFRNPIVSRFLQDVRLAVMVEGLRTYPVVIDMQRCFEFLMWASSFMDNEKRTLKNFMSTSIPSQDLN